MFFFLSKTLGVMLLPSNLLIGVGILGLILLLTRFVSLGRKLVVASVLLLAICGFSPIGNLLLYPLESRFPPWDDTRGAPDGIVVLGGAIEPDLSAAHGTAVFGPSIDRIIAAAGLAHRYPNARIVFSGGNAGLDPSDAAREADFALPVFEELRVFQRPLDHGAAFAQHRGKCRVFEGPGLAEEWRAMAAGDVGLSHGKVGRHLSQGRICGGAVSGRLADGWPCRSPEVFPLLHRRAWPDRYRFARVDGSHSLLDHRQDQRVLPRSRRALISRCDANSTIARFGIVSAYGECLFATVGRASRTQCVGARTLRATILALAAVIMCALPIAVCADHAHAVSGEPATFGTIDFENSCARSVQAEFRTAVAMLHSFAADAKLFVDVAKHDPSCAIAWWGAAMAARGNPLVGELDRDGLKVGQDYLARRENTQDHAARARLSRRDG